MAYQPIHLIAGRDKCSRQYPFSSMIYCGFCESVYSRRNLYSGTDYEKRVWPCADAVKRGKKTCPDSISKIDEKDLEHAFVEAFRLMCNNNKDIITEFLQRVETSLNKNSYTKELAKGEKKIAYLKTRLDRLLEIYFLHNGGTSMAVDVMEQISACLKSKKNFLLSGGAGSGKTYTLLQTLLAVAHIIIFYFLFYKVDTQLSYYPCYVYGNPNQSTEGHILMNGFVIRDIEENDLPVIKSFIAEAWGEGWNFGRFSQNEDLFQALLETYLSMFLNSSTFAKVAVIEGTVMGAVLCSVNGEVETFRQLQKDRILHTLTLLSSSEAERKDIVEHLSVSFQTIGQLLENRVDAYDGSLEFIAVAKQAQGLKVGKILWSEVAEYFKSKRVKAIYLIADSQCNTGFYDNNGFDKIGVREAIYNYTTGQKKFDVYLYDYQF